MDISFVSQHRKIKPPSQTEMVLKHLKTFIDRQPVVAMSIFIGAFGLSLPYTLVPVTKALGLEFKYEYKPSK